MAFRCPKCHHKEYREVSRFSLVLSKTAEGLYDAEEVYAIALLIWAHLALVLALLLFLTGRGVLR